MTPSVHSPGAEPVPRVTLIGRPGCHLCETARSVVAEVTAELGVAWVELSLDDDAELRKAYAERIPVVLIDGEQHEYWRVDARRLRMALTGGKPTWRTRWRRRAHRP